MPDSAAGDSRHRVRRVNVQNMAAQRILVTIAGSVPQPPGLVRRLEAAAATGEADPVALDHDLNGVDIVSDGESDRTGYRGQHPGP